MRNGRESVFLRCSFCSGPWRTGPTCYARVRIAWNCSTANWHLPISLACPQFAFSTGVVGGTQLPAQVTGNLAAGEELVAQYAPHSHGRRCHPGGQGPYGLECPGRRSAQMGRVPRDSRARRLRVA